MRGVVKRCGDERVYVFRSSVDASRERVRREISNHRREGGKVEEDDGEHRGGDKNQGGMIEIFR